ncbi:MAG TPA: transposase, partial [Actinomycetes bacterium]|nr:transposase [Actinomycetes bacterium]
YAAGGLEFDYPGFVHTVLVDMRARLAASTRPDRIFQVTLRAAKAAGLVGRKRVLDSTPLYDAVATMDTVTLIRSALRGVLQAADADTEAALRAVIRREDDYAGPGKPVCDYDDATARGVLVDALARDAFACLAALDGRELDAAMAQAGQLVATLVGQDLDEGADGVFRIARRVAPDRVISTVDTGARHGHKTSARGFDGYKGHVAIDPDSEIITATTVTAGNTGDAAAAADLLAQDLPAAPDGPDDPPVGPRSADTATSADGPSSADTPTSADGPSSAAGPSGADGESSDVAQGGAAGDAPTGEPLAVYGDAAYGAGELLETLERAGVEIKTKVQPPVAPGGRFAKDRFTIDLAAGTVTCPAQVSVAIRAAKAGGGTASFGAACADCPLAAQCTSSTAGRSINIGRYEDQLVRARTAQQDPAWRADYRATRPKVERKIGHLMRRRHGGRRARVRGQTKTAADFSLLAAAANLARLGMLKVTSVGAGRWAAAPG